MKISPSVLSIFLIISCARAGEKTYTGSTPADPVVRTFLGISLQDSVDFIRWQLILHKDNYQLNCNYGVGQPNTNGFINGGKKIEISGALNKEKMITCLATVIKL